MKCLLLILTVGVAVLGCSTPASRGAPTQMSEVTVPDAAAGQTRAEAEGRAAALAEQRRRSAAAERLCVPCDG